MRWSWKIGQVAGIGLYVHATFWLLIAFVLYISWAHGHNLAAALVGAFFVIVIFGCIVLHELGHALTARTFGIKTRDITLLPIGGLARLERMPDKPIQELWVALAGPAVNVVIAIGLFVLLLAMGRTPQFSLIDLSGSHFLDQLMVVNLWLVAFNLLPAFPMDGGRVLRALLGMRMEYTRATHIAARVGQGMAFLFGLAGLLGDPFLLFIALFVWMGAEQEASMAQIHTSMGNIPVQHVMLTDFRSLQPDDTLAVAVEHLLAGWQHDFPVVFGHHALGVLQREDLMRMLTQGGSDTRVRDAMRRDIPIADSHDMLEDALRLFHECKCHTVPVEHDGRLVGLLTMDNVGEFLMIQAAINRRRLGPGRAGATHL